MSLRQPQRAVASPRTGAPWARTAHGPGAASACRPRNFRRLRAAAASRLLLKQSPRHCTITTSADRVLVGEFGLQRPPGPTVTERYEGDEVTEGTGRNLLDVLIAASLGERRQDASVSVELCSSAALVLWMHLCNSCGAHGLANQSLPRCRPWASRLSAERGRGPQGVT